jgi:LysM repeat protein
VLVIWKKAGRIQNVLTFAYNQKREIDMRISMIVRSLLLMLILIGIFDTGFSQVVVERSKDKVIISGVAYYVHPVKKGETPYSVAKAYGISVEELTKENPPAVYGLKEGQALRIPVKAETESTTSTLPAVKKTRDETRFIYHSLKPGETVYFLSKSYGVSENEIVQSNPGIDINKLPVGSEIAVPKRDFMTGREKFDTQKQQYRFHKVQKGESLASIAEKYGLTLRELRKENRDLRFPQVGDFVRVPGTDSVAVAKVVAVIADTVKPVIAETVAGIVKRTGYVPVKDLKGSVNIAVLLPFYLKENSVRMEIDSSKIVKGKRVPKRIDKAEDWIYDASFDFLEMYEGILLACDTLRALGLEINIYPYDIRRDTVEVTKLINSGALASMDLIVGPVYSYNLSAVAAYAGTLNIPVVSPVQLINNNVLTSNPTLFMASASLEVSQRILAKKISEFSDYNIVFIHADTADSDPDVKRFKNLIISELTTKRPYEEIKFKEFMFYSRSMFDNDSINRLGHALSDQSKNVVIIASEDPPVISETIQDIHGLSKKFDLKVFGYPAMADNENLDPKYFFDLGIELFYPSWIDYGRKDVKAFNSDFRQKFLTQPLEKSFAWQGYDLAYYFISGIALFGKEFVAHPELHNPDLLQTEYDFQRKTATDGFENQKLYLIEYGKDYIVKLLNYNELPQIE